MKRTWVRLVVGIVAVLALALAGGMVWLALPQPLLPEAEAALQSTNAVSFAREGEWLTFTPVLGEPRAGLILYPGGRVPPAAYAPAAAHIAAQDFAVFIVPMPLNLALLGIERAAAVQAAHPEITRWAVGGHSLGGSMGAQYAADHPGAVQGVLFWASYSAADLSQQKLKVVSIIGALDAGRAAAEAPATRARLPADAVYLTIPGGNHEQLGYYTGQPNDPPATISRADEQQAAVAAAVQLLEAICAS